MRNRWIPFSMVLVILAGTAWAEDSSHGHAWTYAGAEGPQHWGELQPAYSICKLGKEQSPIDIRNVEKMKLPAIQFDYKPSPLTIVDNGHTIQVDYAPGSFIVVGDKRYELKQFHFHHPSEERIQGESYDMVVHLVHADSAGNLAVIAILVQKGAASHIIQELWARFPKTQGKAQRIAGIQVNAADLLPQNTEYYTYRGSLTTPPCSEGVTWLILKAPTSFSPEQIDAFTRIYSNNARPIQGINGRIVKGSE
jgi:carbonic anhydrase